MPYWRVSARGEVADRNEVTLTEAVRRAIGLLELVDEARRDGTEIHFVDHSGKTRVLELL